MTGPGLSRHAEPVAFDQPLLVVTPPELPKGVGERRDRGEMPLGAPKLVVRPALQGRLRFLGQITHF